jgi:hypothetical protein
MNYQQIYDSLIERGQNRTLEDYTENHHIIPRCMGGSNDKENLVKLTPEEHYVAHQLLVKIYPNNPPLVKAAAMMVPNRPNNKMYGWIRRQFSLVQSESQKGKKNSQYNTMWITNGNISKKISKESIIPDGWVKGRKSKKKYKKQPPKIILFKQIQLCRDCIKEKSKRNAEFWYQQLIKSDSKSIRDFVRNSDYESSHVAFIKMLKKYIPNFNPEQGKSFK